MMNIKKKLTPLISVALLSTLLSACGGGSGSAKTNLQPSPTPPVNTNTAPTLSNSNFSVDEDNALQDKLNANDADGDSISYTLITNVSHGSLSFNIDGSFNYMPNANYFGNDSFSAQVSDGSLSSATVEFSLQVNAVNDAPTILAENKTTRLEQAITFTLTAEDIDGDTLSFSISAAAKQGVAALNDDNSITYTPNAGVEGLDSFTITVTDQNLTATALISIDNGLAIAGNVNGDVDVMSTVKVLLTTEGQLIKVTPDENGKFKFYGLTDGDYAVKVSKHGYKSTPAKLINVDINNLNIAQLPKAKANTANFSQSSSATANDFELTALDSDNFSFHWQEDQSTAGYDYMAYVNQPVTIEFLNEQLEVADESAANQLQHDYNIVLVNSDSISWTQEHAYRLAEIMKTIPQQKRDEYKKQSLTPSKWQLTDDYIEDDIQIVENNGYKTVLISSAAFVNATPKMAKIEGKRGIFYSQRLHHALVKFVTNNGSDETAYEKILNERYGITTIIADYATLTAPTGNESAGRFQKFHADEILTIIDMFEEMPKGMHKLPELKYLLRRLDGTPHPLYPDAPAVAWPDNGYIEFMGSAFNTSNVAHMHRLVLHEKSHFLWAHQFDQQLKNDWITLGGWYQDASTTSGWATTKETEFVSAYAHSKNPNEDMAESISYFIINPDKLKSRAIGKYEFVRDRIMQGNIYISQIRGDLTFQVYNLFPDYVFPGKIKRVDINVTGAAEEDKTVTIEIELHALDTDLEGAKTAYMRILSNIGTFTDLYLHPVDTNGNPLPTNELSTILKGTFTLSKYAKAGYWRTQQITITDAVGNQRMEGANDFGWQLYINNPLEDITPPEYVANTASLTKSTSIFTENGIDHEIQTIHATWQVEEAIQMRTNNPCYASMNDEILSTYRVEKYGDFDATTNLCSADFIMPHYMPSSTYSMNFITMVDQALNIRGTYFTNTNGGLREEDINIDEAPQKIELITNNQDIEQPELDLNNIQITALPTNPDAPNGETIVTVTFKVRDNNSGYNIASLYLRDPQGIAHNFWAYNDDTYTLFQTDDPTQWHTYTRNIVLPVGSAPGTWGMSEMTIYDRAGNFKGYDFTEIVHFDVTE